jgi:LDH2 family malate/lactate/ureidoglycolate dehydrogenase
MSKFFSIPSLFAVLLFSIVIILMVSGCATTLTPSAARIMDADMKVTENCQFVGDVHGSSGWGNLAASTGMENAKNEAKEKAAAMGATHIVWTGMAGGYSPYASGKAYLCK